MRKSCCSGVLCGCALRVTDNTLGPCCFPTALSLHCHFTVTALSLLCPVGCYRLKKKDLKLFESMAALEKSYSKVLTVILHYCLVAVRILSCLHRTDTTAVVEHYLTFLHILPITALTYCTYTLV